MKKLSRRSFFNNLSIGGLYLGAIPFITGNSIKDKSNHKKSVRLAVIDEADICVVGGSCTGVFAAIRASRLGAKVIIIEKQNAFGGVATNALVNVWHSLLDTGFKRQIIAGLTSEVMDRLSIRDAVVTYDKNSSRGFTFNAQELKIELDELILESDVRPFLHTLFSEPYIDKNGKLAGIIIDNKSGRGIIKARYFIDATGDGDLCERLGLESYTRDLLQPPTACAHYEGWNSIRFTSLFREHHKEFDIPEGFVWEQKSHRLKQI